MENVAENRPNLQDIYDSVLHSSNYKSNYNSKLMDESQLGDLQD
jgi:hypothetical protein